MYNRSEVTVDIPTPFFEGSTGYCLVEALSARGIAYRYLSPDEITNPQLAQMTVAAFHINGAQYYFDGGGLRVSDPRGVKVPGPLIDGPIARFVKQKDWVKLLLRDQGFSVPEGAAFPRQAQCEAESFFAAFSPAWSGGVCVKPTAGRKGRQVHLGIRDLASFRAAFAAVGERHNRVLIEETVSGTVYRFFCVADRVVAIRFSRPANVEGDGTHTIADLVELKNAEQRLNPGYAKYLLRLGQQELMFLRQAGLEADHVPEAGKLVFLSSLSNLHQGADIIDATDAVHQSYIELVEHAINQLPGIVLCGPDLVIKDANLPATSDNYHILELNVMGPGFSNHHYPWRGEPRDVAGAIVGYLAASTPSRPTAPVEKIG